MIVRRIALALAFCTGLVLIGCACAASHGPSSSPRPTVVLSATPTPTTPLTPYVGEWFAPGIKLTVNPDGLTGRLDWNNEGKNVRANLVFHGLTAKIKAVHPAPVDVLRPGNTVTLSPGADAYQIKVTIPGNKYGNPNYCRHQPCES